MPKVRKNRRHLFNRRKNDTRKNNTVRDKENTPPALLSTSCVLLTQAEQPNQSLLQRILPYPPFMIKSRRVIWPIGLLFHLIAQYSCSLCDNKVCPNQKLSVQWPFIPIFHGVPMCVAGYFIQMTVMSLLTYLSMLVTLALFPLYLSVYYQLSYAQGILTS